MTRKVKKILGARPDLNPDIPTAGIFLHSDPTTTKDCLDHRMNEPWKKPSMEDYGNFEGKRTDDVVHGIIDKSMINGAEVIFPKKLHPLLVDRERLREKNYHRREHQVLGHTVPTGAVLPTFTLHPDFKFGISTIEDDDVKKILYSALPEDNAQVKRQYIKSHLSYEPGEQRDYDYNWTKYPKNSIWGVKIQHDNDGKRVKDSLYWEEERKSHFTIRELGTKLSIKRLEDYRERSKPALGKVHDPMKDTMNHLPKDHSFGLKFPPDEYTVGDLLGCSTSKLYHQYWGYRTPKDYISTPSRTDPTEIPKISRKKLIRPEVPVFDSELAKIHFLYPRVPLHLLQTPEIVAPKITGDEEMREYRELREKSMEGVDQNRVFGVPTVRERADGFRRKLSDEKNYGDQPGAKSLLSPTPLNVYGEKKLQELAEKYKGMTLKDLKSNIPEKTGSKGGTIKLFGLKPLAKVDITSNLASQRKLPELPSNPVASETIVA
ncbi:hypothetical protein HK098_007886 [Nowakowskiella sp. JEL0407]|nr:hypothetical protein HK098_007886 [Nowakowskiella sp. JEL0407]